ncbi:MAG: acyl-phosphate glycerol 3-phosphate acyltransferase [Elusimicrobia bacterium RIFOXYB2_FULL_49_7]|nr:MAG: acyl-phosphate glycerol 3-phosphate acyltransferase [Elusimicrobia bacterium RIFOXYB2_FULL_49_7]
MEWHIFAVFMLIYLVGSFPTSILTCRLLKGIDIRAHGSGNAGATNVYRIMGFKVALFVLIVDALKGVFGVLAPGWFLSAAPLWQAMAGGLTAILGHVFTVFARFKGGKGVGTALGVFAALLPGPTAVAFAIWILVLLLTRIVSAASMCAGMALAFSAGLFFHIGYVSSFSLVCFAGLIAVLIIVTHRSNIRRLLNGTENKIQFRRSSNP